jgi:CubicO group peptidase (beta-lactamase class C family)
MSHERLLPRSVPSAERVDARSVLALLDRLDERSIECHSLMVVRHGRVVAEGWWAPYGPARPHLLYSLTKSFTSIAVGLAVTDGLLALDDRVADILPDHVPAGVSPRVRELNVHHLLSMTTGHRNDTLAEAWALEPADLVQGFLRVPADYPAGTRQAYNNPTSFVLARMVERVTGRTVPDLLDDRLFGPMGVDHADWDRVASGATFGFHGLYLTTEAVAAFGELLLRHGRWRGRQLVSRAWVELATRRHIETVQSDDGWRTADWLQGYGYHFWMSRHGYRGDGAMGQYCLVVPEHDLVVVITAATTDLPAPLDAVWDCLLPGLDRAGRSGDDQAVTERMRRLCLPMLTGDAIPGRSATAAVDASAGVPVLPDGTVVAIEPGDGGWRVRFDTGGTAFSVDVGHGTWRESAPLGRPVVAVGGWRGGEFVADIYVITSPSRVRLVVTGLRAVATWNIVPLTGPDLLRQLRTPLMTRPDVA